MRRRRRVQVSLVLTLTLPLNRPLRAGRSCGAVNQMIQICTLQLTTRSVGLSPLQRVTEISSTLLSSSSLSLTGLVPSKTPQPTPA